MARGSVDKVVSDRTGKVSWRARFSYTDANGKRQHRSKSFPPPKKRAEDWLRRELDKLYGGPEEAGKYTTVAELYDRWYASVSKHRAPSTARIYRINWTLHIEPVIGASMVADVTTADILRIRDRLEPTHAPSTIASVRIVVRGIFGTALEDGLIETDPSSRWRVHHLQREVQSWTVAETLRFIASAKPGPDDLFLFMAATGMRIGEVIGLHWDDVDIDRKRLYIHHTSRLDRDGRREIADATKTPSSRRTVALPRMALDVLERRAEDRRDGCPLVFHECGLPLQHSTSINRLTRACKRAGVPRITTHGLRHSAATIMADAGVHPKVVSAQLGHKSTAFTLDVYTRVSVDQQERAAEGIDRAFGVPGDD